MEDMEFHTDTLTGKNGNSLLFCLQVLLSDVEAHSPQLDQTVAAARELEDYTDAERASLPDIGYTALQERYETLKVCVSWCA